MPSVVSVRSFVRARSCPRHRSPYPLRVAEALRLRGRPEGGAAARGASSAGRRQGQDRGERIVVRACVRAWPTAAAAHARRSHYRIGCTCVRRMGADSTVRAAPRAPRAVCPSVARTGGPMPRQRRAVACGTGQRAVNATGLGWHWAALAGTAGSLWSPSRPSRSSRYRTASVSATARVLTWGTRSTHMGTRSTHMGYSEHSRSSRYPTASVRSLAVAHSPAGAGAGEPRL
jgi:hypothetical protein